MGIETVLKAIALKPKLSQKDKHFLEEHSQITSKERLFAISSKEKRFHSFSDAAKRHFDVSLERQVVSYWKGQYLADNLEKETKPK